MTRRPNTELWHGCAVGAVLIGGAGPTGGGGRGGGRRAAASTPGAPGECPGFLDRVHLQETRGFHRLQQQILRHSPV